ncbi:tRNA lysidine(34) synthetase TilS [Marinilactibacillus kalidii]|uniref:tRNA lysidine(34) synthetase TilS n=1 Tax=Marinilactibacillus kalidii TaxID=2820274 RepID=UPI001ABEAF38|nr:tRNA lysidine(34) synthetase TilS [Marinilactibacillus kalidii]
MQLAEHFTASVEKHNDFSQHDRVLVAVSGGVDSVVLVDLLRQLPKVYRPQLSIAHVDHQLRPSSSEDKAVVERLSHTLGVPFYSFTWSKQHHPKSGIEKAARDQRYAFFSTIMNENGLNKLVTGHHKGDQAETILMRMVRGSALEYLTGIKRTRTFNENTLIRPLLDVPKSAIYRYAKDQKLTYVEDETNQQLDYTRNRYRNKILPLLKKENKAVETHLADLSKDVTDVWSIAQPVIESRSRQCATFKHGSVEIDGEMFLNETTSMQRQMLKFMLNHIYKHSTMIYKQKHIELIMEWLIQSGPNSSLDLPGQYQAVKSYQKVSIQKNEISKANRIIQPMYLNLGEWLILPDDRKISLCYSNALPIGQSFKRKIFIASDAITLPLRVRNRQNGDRISPYGMTGTKKVKDLLIDKKIPKEKRDTLVMVEDAVGNMIWIIDIQESRLSIDAKPDKMQYVLLLEET